MSTIYMFVFKSSICSEKSIARAYGVSFSHHFNAFPASA